MTRNSFRKLSFLLITVVLSGTLYLSTTYATLAPLTPPPSGGYDAGTNSILDPGCGPTDTDCFVKEFEGWKLTGNAGTTAGTNFIGTTDAEDFMIKTNGNQIALFGQNGNVAIGFEPVGIYSGLLTTPSATGLGSTAFGFSSFASGQGSFALAGNGIASPNNAVGDLSFVQGQNNTAPSFLETVFGSGATTYTPVDSVNFNSFDRLFTVGNDAGGGFHNAYTLWKDGSFVYNDDNFQNDNPGTEQNMFYFNYGNHDGAGGAQSKRAIRMGSVLNDEYNIASTNVGNRSIAIGFQDENFLFAGLGSFPFAGPVASGDDSFAIGTGTVSSGGYSMAVGHGAQATNTNAHAFGFGSIASGIQSTAIGPLATAAGEGSTAVGVFANAVGDGSLSIGNGFAFAQNSMSYGLGNAYSLGETNIGMRNTSYTPANTTSWNLTDRLFTIGGGDANNISPYPNAADAFTILKNGKTGIGYDNFETTVLTALLQVNGDIQQTGATSCSLSADADGIIICTPSDENLKTNINNITYGLNTLIELRPVSYIFRDVKYGAGNQVGFLAQELEQIIPEVVTNGPDYKSVNYGLITPVIVKAIQEMNLKITDINNTETPNTWRDALIAWFGNAKNGITEFIAGTVRAKNNICIDDVCIDKEQLRTLLQNNNITPSPTPIPVPTTGDDVVPAGNDDQTLPTDNPTDDGTDIGSSDQAVTPPADTPSPTDTSTPTE